MYRLATSLAMLIVLLAAGCGGSDGGGPEPPESAVAGVSQGAGEDRHADSGASDGAQERGKKRTPKKRSARGDKDEAENARRKSTTKPDSAEEAIERLPREQKDTVIETVVRSALLQFGLKLSRVDVKRGGRAVNVVVTRKSACRAVASQEANMVVAIQHGAPDVKSVRFDVAGTGQKLGYYVLGCKKPKIPSGPGRVVLRHTGVGGPYTSKRLRITSNRWALEWENRGASLAVIVAPIDGESKGKYFKPVGSQEPESGRYEYKGTGIFRLKAYGAGQWTVRVKELANRRHR